MRIATVIVGAAMLASVGTTPVAAVSGACERDAWYGKSVWRVSYECRRSPFDSQAKRRVDDYAARDYPTVLTGRAGPWQRFNLRVNGPDVHGLWRFTGQIGRKPIRNGWVKITVTKGSNPPRYHVVSGMTRGSERIDCAIKGRPEVSGWRASSPKKAWGNPKTWPSCQATTVLMFDLVLQPHFTL